jgi:Polyketide cyclase / dehydrase and lipid transport
MYTFEHTVQTTASPDAIWALYADVNAWLRWDHGLDAVALDGPFEAGVSGRITPKGMGELPFVLTRVEPGRGFDDETPAMGHVLRFIHRIEPLASGGARVTHRVEIDGPAADEMGPNVTGDTPEAVAALVALAEHEAATAR